MFLVDYKKTIKCLEGYHYLFFDSGERLADKAESMAFNDQYNLTEMKKQLKKVALNYANASMLFMIAKCFDEEFCNGDVLSLAERLDDDDWDT